MPTAIEDQFEGNNRRKQAIPKSNVSKNKQHVAKYQPKKQREKRGIAMWRAPLTIDSQQQCQYCRISEDYVSGKELV
jgi:hypothetical protein